MRVQVRSASSNDVCENCGTKQNVIRDIEILNANDRQLARFFLCALCRRVLVTALKTSVR